MNVVRDEIRVDGLADDTSDTTKVSKMRPATAPLRDWSGVFHRVRWHTRPVSMKESLEVFVRLLPMFDQKAARCG